MHGRRYFSDARYTFVLGTGAISLIDRLIKLCRNPYFSDSRALDESRSYFLDFKNSLGSAFGAISRIADIALVGSISWIEDIPLTEPLELYLGLQIKLLSMLFLIFTIHVCLGMGH